MPPSFRRLPGSSTYSSYFLCLIFLLTLPCFSSSGSLFFSSLLLLPPFIYSCFPLSQMRLLLASVVTTISPIEYVNDSSWSSTIYSISYFWPSCLCVCVGYLSVSVFGFLPIRHLFVWNGSETHPSICIFFSILCLCLAFHIADQHFSGHILW